MSSPLVVLAMPDGAAVSALQDFLGSQACRALPVSGPDRFWNVVREEQPAVVVLDAGMIPQESVGLVSAVRSLSPQALVVLLVEHPDEDGARAALADGAFDYLGRNVAGHHLLERIMDALRAAGPAMDREYLASEIMIPIRSYTCVQADNTVQEGIEHLRHASQRFISSGLVMQEGHRAVLVFDDERLVGVLAMKNLIDNLRPGYVPGDGALPPGMEHSSLFWSGLVSRRMRVLAEYRIRDIMNPPPPLVPAASNLMHVVYVLCRSDRRRVAVEQDGRIVGVIREQELFHEISRQLVGDV